MTHFLWSSLLVLTIGVVVGLLGLVIIVLITICFSAQPLLGIAALITLTYLVVKYVNSENISDPARFIDDIGADSLDIVELVMDLEQEFEITIPDEEAQNIRTLGELIDYIMQHPRE